MLLARAAAQQVIEVGQVGLKHGMAPPNFKFTGRRVTSRSTSISKMPEVLPVI